MSDDLVIESGWLLNANGVKVRIPLRPLLAGLLGAGILAAGEPYTSDAIVDLSADMADAMLKRLAEKPQEEEVPG